MSKHEIEIIDDKYIVAVSGGVDSMVLLDILYKKFGASQLIVAHYDHSVRSSHEAELDRQVVEGYCDSKSIKIIYGKCSGGDDSEASLRQARYDFLYETLQQYDYNKVITAHHEDDLIETAIINMIRGTKGAGLNSINNSGKLRRPLLDWSKDDILEYAKANGIVWHEDSTNTDENYLRNYVRLNMIPRLQQTGQLDKLKQLIGQQAPLEQSADEIVDNLLNANLLQLDGGLSISRFAFINYPHSVSMRIMRRLLGDSNFNIDVSSNLLLKATIFAKTAKTGLSMDLGGGAILLIKDKSLQLLQTN